jgi:hypothetical protein
MGSEKIRSTPHHWGSTLSLRVAIPMIKKPMSETHRHTPNVGSRSAGPERLPDTKEIVRPTNKSEVPVKVPKKPAVPRRP